VDVSTEDAGVVELSIPAKAEYIVLCRLALTGLARQRALHPEVLADLKLAITEACSNSIRHAYDGGSGTVAVRYELRGDRLSVQVVDEGTGFDPAAAPETDDELDEGGLGIAIIRALVDELEIDSTSGSGSSLRFTKILA
jgi:serine/threonine-protein kinase RsbW